MTHERDELADALHPDLLAGDERSEPIAPSAGLRDAVLRSVTPAFWLDGFAARFAALFDIGIERAREILAAAGDPARAPWVVAGELGVRLLHFEGGSRVADADCGLVQIGAEVRFPRHRHRGDEWSFILAGSGEEEGTGSRWEPGDLVVRRAGTSHAFRAIGPEPLLFAVVLRGGIDLER